MVALLLRLPMPPQPPLSPLRPVLVLLVLALSACAGGDEETATAAPPVLPTGASVPDAGEDGQWLMAAHDYASTR